MTISRSPRRGREGKTTTDVAAPNSDELRVLLADGHAPARVGIKRVLEPHGLRVVAEASNAADAHRMAVVSLPEVCVLAVELPGSGIEAARLIKQSVPSTKIVLMTASMSDEDLFQALRAGADGYLPISTPADRLPYVIRGVAHGEAVLPRELTAHLISEFRVRGTRRRLSLPAGRGEAELTAREFEVLGRLQLRERTPEIAARLGISEVTVRRHVSSVLRKLGTPNRRGAVELFEQAEQL